MLEERDHAVVLRTLAGGAMPTPRSTLDTILRRERWHVRGTGWIGDAIYGVNDGLGAVFGIVSGMAGYTGGSEVVLAAGLAGTLASALSMGAGAYLASKSRARGLRIGGRAGTDRDRRGPARGAARARAVLPAQGLLGRRSAGDGGADAEGAEAVSAHARPRGARPVARRRFRTRGAPRSRPRVSTAIGGFIPIIPFFFTVGMPAVIASFIISTLAHFVVGASKALVTTRSWWASGIGMTMVGRHRGGHHLWPWRGLRGPRMSCRSSCLHRRTDTTMSAEFAQKIAVLAGTAFAPQQASAVRPDD